MLPETGENVRKIKRLPVYFNEKLRFIQATAGCKNKRLHMEVSK
jgi:hypothetical protein